MVGKRGFRQNSIGYRQARAIVVAALAVGCIAFLIQFSMLSIAARQTLSEREFQILSVAEETAVTALAERDAALAREMLRSVLRVTGVTEARLLDADGVIFARENGYLLEAPSSPLERWVAGVFLGEHATITHPLWIEPGVGSPAVGSLEVEFSLDHDIALYRHVLLASLIATILGALIVGAVVAALCHVFLTRPILSISRQVAEVDTDAPRGNLLTIPRGHRDSELGAAVQRINMMLMQLGAAQNALKRMTTRDTSTNLPNRILTVEHLRAVAERSGSGNVVAVLAVLMDRLDDFKDLFGHDKVDEMVLDLAGRLLELVESGTFVGRVGADCFALVMEGLESSDAAGEAARRLVDALMHGADEPLDAVRSSVVVGIACLPEHGADASDLLRKAVAATASARRRPLVRWAFFEDGPSELAHHRLMLESQLHQALDLGEFDLHYQPQFSARGVVTGAEALLRWRCNGELVMPGAFVEVAEDTGLVVPIGDWVLEEACRTAARLRDISLDIRIAINVSPQQLEDGGFVGRAAAAFERYGVPPSQIEIEITEYTLAMERGPVLDRLRALRAMGVRIALDDFGTGYSSLAYLRRFPVDVLKIDRGFVTDIPDDVAVPSTILTLADKLGMICVAEGIETVPQRDWLLANGCDTFQGFLFGRPMPLEAFIDRFAAPSGVVDLGFRRTGHVID